MLLLHDAQHIWDTIPSGFCYDASCWDRLTPSACLVSHAIYLGCLYSVFQIQRILRRENPRVVADLVGVCMQMLSAVIDLAKQKGHSEEIQERFTHVFLYYGPPSAGALVHELRDCAQAGWALPTPIPRSQIIRSLSSFVSWFEDTAAPSSQECGACVVTTRVISHLLDDALNHEAKPFHHPESIDMQNSGEIHQDGAHGLNMHVSSQGQDEPTGQINSFPNSGLDEQLLGYKTSEEFLSWLDSLDWGTPFPTSEFGLLPHDIT